MNQDFMEILNCTIGDAEPNREFVIENVRERAIGDDCGVYQVKVRYDPDTTNDCTIYRVCAFEDRTMLILSAQTI